MMSYRADILRFSVSSLKSMCIRIAVTWRTCDSFSVPTNKCDMCELPHLYFLRNYLKNLVAYFFLLESTMRPILSS